MDLASRRTRRALTLLLAGLLGLSATVVRAAAITADGAGCSLEQAILSANDDAAPGGSTCVAGSGADVITLDYDVTLAAAYAGTVIDSGTGAGLPNVEGALTIVAGAGDTVERLGTLGCDSADPDSFRLFHVGDVLSGNLTLRGLTLRNGCAAPATAPALGGAVTVRQFSSLTLDRVALTDNMARGADGTGQYADGGALHAAQASGISISGSSVLRNTARGGSGATGGAASGGALHLFNTHVTSIADSTFDENLALGGAGSANNGGSALGGAVYAIFNQIDAIERCFFGANQAQGGASTTSQGGAGTGGALDVHGLNVVPVLRDSLFEENQALGGAGATFGGGGSGGGLAVFGSITSLKSTSFVDNLAQGGDAPANPANADGGGITVRTNGQIDLVENCTVANNTARAGDVTGDGSGETPANGRGGGVRLEDEIVAFRSNTVVGNLADGGDGVSQDGEGQGGGLWAGAAVDLTGNLIADNTVTSAGQGASNQDCFNYQSSALVSSGYNLVEAPHASCSFDATGDLTGVDPELAAKGDNGCLKAPPGGACVPTVAFADDAPPVDAGSCSSGAVTTDGRGVARPYDEAASDADDGCDMGAFELDPTFLFVHRFETGDRPWSVVND